MNRQSAPPGPRSAPITLTSTDTADDGLPDRFLAVPAIERVGICCSGGGIRSAAFSLGALQALRVDGLLGRADHLACVSGGGYISIAHAVLVSESPQPGEAGGAGFSKFPPYAQGSPEEKHLRNNLHYLAPGLSGKVWAGLCLGYGVIRHMAPFLAWIISVGFAYGWLLERFETGRLPIQESLWQWLLFVVVVTLVIGIEARHHIVTRDNSSKPMRGIQRGAVAIVGLLLLALLLLWAIPLTLRWLSVDENSDNVSLLDRLLELLPNDLDLPALGALAGPWAILVALTSLVPLLLRKTSRTWVRMILLVLALLSGPLLVLLPFMWAANLGAGGESLVEDQSCWVFWVAAIIAFLSILGNEVMSRTHLYYRERLATAFIGYRKRLPNRLEYQQPEWSDPINFSELQTKGGQNRRVPNLVVCAAANLSTDVPPGRGAATFTFEKDQVGGPLTKYMATRQFEAAAGRDVVTLPALMAVSGAMLGPSMGRFTQPVLRYLMAFFNLRLGVWLPNPLSRDGAQTATEVRMLTESGQPLPEATTPIPKTPLLRKPGSLYILREAFGLNNLDRPFVYVSDGGHYENLGLVELLRRGCGQIVCIDASGSKGIDGLMEAVALAESELDVSICFTAEDLIALIPDETRYSARAFATGRIHYPDKTLGMLYYIRSNVTPDMPAELRNLADRETRFPRHGTGNQFLSEPVFEGYRQLGYHHTMRAAQSGPWPKPSAGLSPTRQPLVAQATDKPPPTGAL